MTALFKLFLRLIGVLSAEEHGNASVSQHYTLVKFDGKAPMVGELKEPAEIIEGGDDKPTERVYRKGEGAEKHLYTNDGSGYAVLKKVVKR